MRLLLLSLLLLSGCGDGLEKTVNVQTTTITWNRSVPTKCGAAAPPFFGCADRGAGYKTCVITMPEDARNDTIAEEFKHCFGYEHAK